MPTAVGTTALATADGLAQALSDPHTVFRGDRRFSDRARSQSLAQGAAGIALLHIERARRGRADWATAHEWLKLALRGEVSAGARAGLFYGAPALAFITHRAAGGADRYRRVLASLDSATLTVTRARLAGAHQRIESGEHPSLDEFDLLRGLSGLAAYHLSRQPEHDVTRDVLSCLVRMTEPLPASPEGLPPWWTRDAPDGSRSTEYPYGHGNLGMSHGISSVLSVLSLALLRGLDVPGAEAAVQRICAWTDEWRQGDADAPWWPALVTAAHPAGDARPERMRRPRPSWCYGVSGTARAQQLAGCALDDVARVTTAERAMLATLRDASQLDGMSGIGLCHGLAGLLQAAWRMAGETGNVAIAAELPRLADRLLSSLAREGSGPDLLEGSAGAALALYAFATDGSTGPPHWDTCLALA